MKKKLAPPPKREEVLFVRMSKDNKQYIKKQAKLAGFRDVASYIEALINSLRAG